MTVRGTAGPPRVVAGALLLLLVGQGLAAVVLRHDATGTPPPAACGTPVPPVDRVLPLDTQLQLRSEPAVGGRSAGTAVVVNRGSRSVAVLTTQAVLLAPAGRVPVSPPEAPRPATGLLRPGQFLRQPVAVTARPCPGAHLTPGFYEVALVVLLQRVGGGAPVRTVTSRVAVVVRPAAS